MLSSTLLLAAAAAGLGSNGVAAQSSTTSSVAAASPTTKPTTVVLVIDQTANNVLPLPFSRGLKEPYIPASAASQGPNGINLSTIPHFQVYNAELARSILSENTSVVELVREEGYAFAHEAITYFPQDDSLFFCSNAGAPNGRSNLTTNNAIFTISNLTDVAARAANGNTSFAQDVHQLPLNDTGVQMTNGGAPYGPDHYLVVNQGRGADLPGGLALIPRANTSTAKVILNNAYGKQFDSPNDVAIHPTTGQIAFTDSQYGITQYFRPPGVMPLQTWLFDAQSGYLKVLDDTVAVPNGVAITPDGKTLYICDTAPQGYDVNATRSATIKAFDMLTYPLNGNSSSGTQQEGGSGNMTHSLVNSRIFAWPQTGFCDGIKIDNNGNVYTGTSDGVQVFSPQGDTILKIFLPGDGAVNLAFAGEGRLAVTSEETIYLVQGLGVGAPDLTMLPPEDKRIKVDLP